jgi:hypothetical protein
MAFAPGPWFLIEAGWVDRTAAMRDRLRQRVREMGYRLSDPDRGGEKGFTRIDEGFTTRPDSGAMRRHFLDRGDPQTAALFRPSSMEHVRSLGGDPFTFVSEMPLFLLPRAPIDFPDPTAGTEGRVAFHRWLADLIADRSGVDAARAAVRHGIRPMPIRDQARLQLGLVDAALAAAWGSDPSRDEQSSLRGCVRAPWRCQTACSPSITTVRPFPAVASGVHERSRGVRGGRADNGLSSGHDALNYTTT